MSNLYTVGTLNLLISYIGVFIAFLINFLRAKVITPEEIGLLSTFISIASIFQCFIVIGLPATILKYYSVFKDNLKERSTFIFFTLLIPLVLFFFISAGLIFFKSYFLNFFHNQLFNKYFYFIFLFLLGESICSIFSFLYQVTYFSVISNLIHEQLGRFLQMFLLFFMLVIDIPFNIFLIFNIIFIFVRISFFIFYFPGRIKVIKPSPAIILNKTYLGIVKYSFFMFMSGAAGVITAYVDKLLLGHFLSMEDVGIYSIAYGIGIFLESIGRAFSRIAHPLIAECWNKNDLKSIKEIYSNNTQIQLFMGTLLFIIFSLFSKEILTVFGKDYAKGYWVLIIISFSELINIGTGMCGGIISFSKNYKVDLYTRFILLFLAVGVYYIFIPPFGLIGAAAGTAMALAVYNLTKVVYVYLKFKLSPYNGSSLKILLLNLLLFLIIFEVKGYMKINFNIINLFFTFVLITVLYCLIAFYLFKIIEVKMFFNDLLKKFRVAEKAG